MKSIHKVPSNHIYIVNLLYGICIVARWNVNVQSSIMCIVVLCYTINHNVRLIVVCLNDTLLLAIAP